eukprot:scaffold85579_cov36-Tisochrysis_lutea.AAC.1
MGRGLVEVAQANAWTSLDGYCFHFLVDAGIRGKRAASTSSSGVRHVPWSYRSCFHCYARQRKSCWEGVAVLSFHLGGCEGKVGR